MFHPNHNYYRDSIKEATAKPEATFPALIYDDAISPEWNVSKSNAAYKTEKWGKEEMIDIFTKQGFELKARDGGHTTFAVYENDAVFGTINRGCHAMLDSVSQYARFYNVKVKELWVSLWAPINKTDEATVYWNYMLDPKISPWRGCLENSEIIYADHPTDKRYKKRPVAFVIRQMDAPYQLIGSLCIASRMCWAMSGYLPAFTTFIKKGFSIPDAAFLCASVFKLPGDDAGFGYPYTGDYAFDTYTYYDMEYPRFINGNPDIPTPNSVHNGGTYNYTNRIFGRLSLDREKLTDTSRFWTYKQCVRYAFGNRPAVYQDTKIIPNYIQFLCSKKGTNKTRFSGGNTVAETFVPLPLDEAIANLKKHEELWKDGKAH